MIVAETDKGMQVADVLFGPDFKRGMADALEEIAATPSR